MSMNDLLIEAQNQVTALTAERDQLAVALCEANNKLDDVRDSFCGRNLMISGWHLNGDLEPVDNWFDSNDWDPVQVAISNHVDDIRAKAVMNFAEVPRGAYLSGGVTAELTVYDVYQSARNHVKQSYGYDTQLWDDDNATTARNALNELSACAGKAGFIAGVLRVNPTAKDRESLNDEANKYADSIRQAAKGGE